MTHLRTKVSLVFMLISSLAACELPRGAALQSEILANAGSENPEFAVYPVTRENLGLYSGWPATGEVTNREWLPRTRGPASAMIAVGDQINLKIWDSEDNSLLTTVGQKAVEMNGVEVSPQGTIFVPYLEEVYVAKMTPDQARQTIQSQLSTVVPSGQVQLNLVSGRKNSVDLVSGVIKPGNYPMPDRDFSILALISQGGGISNGLRNPQLRLVRDGKLYATSIDSIYKNPGLDTTLRGGDKVFVEEDDRYFLSLGAAGREDVIYFPDERLSALDAVSLVRGVNDNRGNPKGVLILRQYPDSAVRSDEKGPSQKRAIFTVDLTTADGLFSAGEFEVRPKDLVLITESLVNSTATILGILGSAVNIGDKLN